MSPAAPASLVTVPENGEGTSTTALAVSIDTSGSSRRTLSPSLTNHSTMVASGRPSPRSGRWKFLAWLMADFSRRQRRRGVVEEFEVGGWQPALRAIGTLGPPPTAMFVMQQHVLALHRNEFACVIIAQGFGQAVAQGAQPRHRRPASVALPGVDPGKGRPFFIAHADCHLLAGVEANRVGDSGVVVAEQAGAHVSRRPPRDGRR